MKCAWPRCRQTEIDVIWLGVPLCARCHGRINSNDPDGERPLSQHGLEEAKRILKVNTKGTK